MKRPTVKAIALSVALFASCATRSNAAVFVDLGVNVTGVGRASTNGQWVAGTIVSADQTHVNPDDDYELNTVPFRWSLSTGIEALESAGFRRGTGISNDGNILIGTGRGFSSGTGPFYWSQFNGLTDIGTIPGAIDHGDVVDLSADSTVMVGSAGDDQSVPGSGMVPQAFRRAGGSVPTGLGDLPGGDFRSLATAVSTDGMTVVGLGTYFGDVGSEATRWRADTGMVGLGFVSDRPQSAATDVSNDGNIVVGYGYGPSGDAKAFRWVAGSGMTELDFYAATAATGDGLTIVGLGSDGFGGQRAVIWDSTHGTRTLLDVLKTDYGLTNALADFRELTSVVDISPDGRTMTGYGIKNFNDAHVAWIVTSVPEPCTSAMLLEICATCLFSQTLFWRRKSLRTNSR